MLKQPATIRARCGNVLQAVREGRSTHFTVDESRLDEAAAWVERVTRTNYPTLRIPYHSRWRHFEAGGVDRKERLDPEAYIDFLSDQDLMKPKGRKKK